MVSRECILECTNKMTNRFCLMSDFSIGCTFVDWSVYWLAKQDDFYAKTNWVPLVSNPLSKTNAHSHQKNHPSGQAETSSYIESFKTVSSHNLLSLYPTQLHWDMAARELSIPLDESLKESNHNVIVNHTRQDFAQIWRLCHENNFALIYFNLSSSPVYQLSVRVLGRQLLNDKRYTSVDETIRDYFDAFFKNEYTPLSVWDCREIYALNVRPYAFNNIKEQIDFSLPHLLLDSQEIWHDGEQALTKILNYLNLKIDKDRLIKWLPIYKEWQKIQHNTLKFSWNFEHICTSIVNNYYFDLSEYNLNIVQEAAIQHVMIYKHGLTFKAYGLEKFPDNTQELHKLLEPNIYHKVENIYGLL